MACWTAGHSCDNDRSMTQTLNRTSLRLGSIFTDPNIQRKEVPARGKSQEKGAVCNRAATNEYVHVN